MGLWYNGAMLTNSSKSVLAKVLACENISVVYDHKAITASFDVRNRVLRLPMIKDISDELQDLFVGHEVGHALFTPYTKEDEKSFKEFGNFAAAVDIGGANCDIAAGYINVIEDTRIDKLMKEKFAGLRRDYRIGYQELNDMDFFATKGKDLNTLPFIDRINLHFKSGTAVENLVKFSDEEQILVDKIAKTNTFDEVIQVTREVWEFCGKKKEQFPPDNKSDLGVDFEVDKTNGNSDIGGSVVKIGNGEEVEGDTNDKAGNGTKSDKQLMETKMPDRCSTQEAFNRKMAEMITSNTTEVVNQTIPDVNIDNVIIDYKEIIDDFVPYARQYVKEFEFADKTYQGFAKSSKNVVNILVKQFLMKKSAESARRTQQRKSGSLDPVKMMNYHFNDDIFLRHQIHYNGKSHGLVFFMDWSGSMSPILKDTLHQLFQIVFFCRRMNIPFEVYAFTNCYHKSYDDYCGDEYGDSRKKYNRQYVQPKVHFGQERCMQNFALLNILSSRMSTSDYNVMMRNLFLVVNYNDGSCTTSNVLPYRMRLSSTPLNESINAAIQIVNKYKVDNKLDIVNTVFLTDGEATGSYVTGSGYGTESYIHKGNCKIHVSDWNRGTDSLIQMFRQLTDSKAIGIFLDSKRGLSSLAINKFFANDPNGLVNAEKMYKDEGFCVASKKCHSYDELFIIRGNFEVEDDNVEQILSSKNTKVAIRNAFIRTMSNKTTSRVMLNRFIDLIA
jgi:hypothetical protein